MKEASKVIMGATVVMVVSLAIVLGLVLVLLAELYCSLILRRRLLKPATTAGARRLVPTATAVARANDQLPSSPLSSFFSTETPHSPKPSQQDIRGDAGDENGTVANDIEAQRGKLGQLLTLQRVSSIPLEHPTTSHTGTAPPFQASSVTEAANEVFREEEKVMYYISNPIYDNDVTTTTTTGERRQQRTRTSGVQEGEVIEEDTPPFETPESSPSQLEEETAGDEYCSRGDEEVEQRRTLPKNLLKEIQAKAIYVAARRKRMSSAGTDSSE